MDNQLPGISPKIPATPITPIKNRILSLDVLRGFALLGILTMNIIIFALPFVYYSNPLAGGEPGLMDKWVFSFNYVFCNLRFMSIFSILFGAGIVLFTQNATRKSDVHKARELHYVRNFWLLIFGLLHAYLIWYGDILAMYAICSIWLYLFRNKSPKTLLIWAGSLIAINALFLYGSNQALQFAPEEVISDMCEKQWFGTEESLQKEIDVYRGGWVQQMSHRVSFAFKSQMNLLFFGGHTTALMLIGMALFKLNILTAKKSKAFYVKMLLISLAIGLPASIFWLNQNNVLGWSCDSLLKGLIYVSLSSLPMALAYIAIIMLLCKSKFNQVLFNWLAPVGKMALTNYLMQSLIATSIFYGHGLGLFGNYGRAELCLFVVGIWIFQIIFSHYWMRYFLFGPFEWLWRSLTYWKLQPMRKLKLA